VVFDLDADGKRLRMVKLTEYAGEKGEDPVAHAGKNCVTHG